MARGKYVDNDFYIVSEKVETSKIQMELTELMLMVDSMLQLIAEELHNVVKCTTQLWFVQAWLQYSKITQELYECAYGNSESQAQSVTVLLINPNLEKSILRESATSYIYQLQSLSHLAAYVIFTSYLDSHLQNSLIIIDRYMQRAVYLIDLLLLEEFKQIKPKH